MFRCPVCAALSVQITFDASPDNVPAASGHGRCQGCGSTWGQGRCATEQWDVVPAAAVHSGLPDEPIVAA